MNTMKESLACLTSMKKEAGTNRMTHLAKETWHPPKIFELNILHTH